MPSYLRHENCRGKPDSTIFPSLGKQGTIFGAPPMKLKVLLQSPFYFLILVHVQVNQPISHARSTDQAEDDCINQMLKDTSQLILAEKYVEYGNHAIAGFH